MSGGARLKDTPGQAHRAGAGCGNPRWLCIAPSYTLAHMALPSFHEQIARIYHPPLLPLRLLHPPSHRSRLWCRPHSLVCVAAHISTPTMLTRLRFAYLHGKAFRHGNIVRIVYGFLQKSYILIRKMLWRVSSNTRRASPLLVSSAKVSTCSVV